MVVTQLSGVLGYCCALRLRFAAQRDFLHVIHSNLSFQLANSISLLHAVPIALQSLGCPALALLAVVPLLSGDA